MGGDRIRQIRAQDDDTEVEQKDESLDSGKTMSASAMFAELHAATKFESPRVVNLSVSRDLTGVMKLAAGTAGVESSTQYPPGSTKSNLNDAKGPVSPLPPRAPPTPPKIPSA